MQLKILQYCTNTIMGMRIYLWDQHYKIKKNCKCSYNIESKPRLPVHCTRIKSINSHIKKQKKLANITNVVL